MTTLVILDDDKLSRTRTRTLIERAPSCAAGVSILEASCADDLYALFASGVRIDILVADILMPEGEPSGIDLVQQLFPASSTTQVIYVSGSMEQALEVYRTTHVYFLLKPLDEQRLEDALGRAMAALSRRQASMLRIKSGYRDRLVSCASIWYLESNLHKVLVHCGTQTFETYAKLDDLHAQLPGGFSRCHRSFVVNLAQVSQLNEDELLLSDGTRIPVSRRRARQLQHDLLEFLSQRG